MCLQHSILLLALLGALSLCADDLSDLCADRAAVERVYYNHRTGTKPPFEQVLPAPAIEKLVRHELLKESVLKQRYGVEITPAIVDDEVRRINTTTRAPAILAEIKHALQDRPERFARTVARPLVVERILRDRFENDAALHASHRRRAELLRTQLLAARLTNASPAALAAILKTTCPALVTDTTWLLEPRPASPHQPTTPTDIEIKQRFGPGATLLSPSTAEKDRQSYFSDLPPALQSTLRAQLRRPGDVTAVIELPDTFLLYVCTTNDNRRLAVAGLSLLKTGFEQWLSSQPLPDSR